MNIDLAMCLTGEGLTICDVITYCDPVLFVI